jgi:hypothetical protein
MSQEFEVSHYYRTCFHSLMKAILNELDGRLANRCILQKEQVFAVVRENVEIYLNTKSKYDITTLVETLCEYSAPLASYWLGHDKVCGMQKFVAFKELFKIFNEDVEKRIGDFGAIDASVVSVKSTLNKKIDELDL